MREKDNTARKVPVFGRRMAWGRLDLNDLRLLMEVVTHGGFTAALVSRFDAIVFGIGLRHLVSPTIEVGEIS